MEGTIPCPEGSLVLSKDIKITGNLKICSSSNKEFFFFWDCAGYGGALTWVESDGTEKRFIFHPSPTRDTPRLKENNQYQIGKKTGKKLRTIEEDDPYRMEEDIPIRSLEVPEKGTFFKKLFS